MMVMSRKRFEEEVNRRVWEEERRREMMQRFERVDRRMNDLESQIYELRMKTDPEFARKNTPTCSIENTEPVNLQAVG